MRLLFIALCGLSLLREPDLIQRVKDDLIHVFIFSIRKTGKPWMGFLQERPVPSAFFTYGILLFQCFLFHETSFPSSALQQPQRIVLASSLKHNIQSGHLLFFSLALIWGYPFSRSRSGRSRTAQTSGSGRSLPCSASFLGI